MRRLAVAIALCTLAVGAFATPASARTYDRGHTVFFSDETIGFGDEVRGDLEIMFGNVTCTRGGLIDGNVRTYFGDFTQLDGCIVGGRVMNAFNGEDWSVVPFVPHESTLDMFVANRRVWQNLAWDVVILFIFLLFPLRVRVALDRVERHPGWSAIAGTIALIAVLPLFVVLLLSIVGIPLIVLEIAALFAGLAVGYAAVAMLVGRRLYELVRPRATPSPLFALVLGLIVTGAAQTLPVVGWAVTALVGVVGLGAAALGLIRESAFGHDVGGLPMNRPA
jgi:hypothetical protein